MDDEITFQRLWTIMRGGRYVIFLCALLIGVIGAYYAYFVAEPRFRATAVIEFKSREQAPLDLSSIVSGSAHDTATINTQIERIRSRRVVEKVVKDLELTKLPEFNAAIREPSFSLRQTILNLIGMAPALIERSPSEQDAKELRDTTAAVREGITVIGGHDSYLFQIRVEASRPYIATDIANAVAEAYITGQLAEKAAEAEQAITWMSERVNELENDLQEREDQIKELEAKSESITQAAITALQSQAIDFRKRVDDTARQVESAKVRLSMLRDAGDSRDKARILLVFDDPRLTRFAGRATESLDGTGATDAAFLAMVDQLTQAQENEVVRIEQALASLSASWESLEKRAVEQAELFQSYTQMRRELGVTEELYQTFLTGLREASVQVGLVRADAQIMAHALPPYRPFAPRRSLIVMMCLFLGACLGFAVTLFKEVSRSNVRSSSELSAISHLPVVGEIPKIPIRSRGQLFTFLQENKTSAAMEALRNLRTTVLMSNAGNPPQVIMVTSTVPGEGKTTVSLGLVNNLASLGKRVLLLEGDIRRHSLEYYLAKPAAHQNWLQIITGETTIEEAVMHSPELGADVLMGRSGQSNAADILSSQQFEQLMNKLRQKYDHIVIDTPPVMLVADARIVARQCDSVLYCVHWNVTHQTQVLSGVAQLESVGVNLTGFVLSQIDIKRMHRYQYDGQYATYGAYGKGYYGR